MVLGRSMYMRSLLMTKVAFRLGWPDCRGGQAI